MCVADEALEQVEELLISPVDVLDEQDSRLFRHHLRHEIDPGVLETVPSGQWVEPVRDVKAERQPEDLAGPQPREGGCLGVTVQDAEVLLEHVPERTIGDSSAVGETTPGAARDRLQAVTEIRPELAHQACLPNPDITEDSHQPWFLRLHHPVEHPLELTEFVRPSYEGTLQPTHATRSRQ